MACRICLISDIFFMIIEQYHGNLELAEVLSLLKFSKEFDNVSGSVHI